jgi:hypothetical protein
MSLFTSCFKKDKMVPAHDQGDVTTVVIPMTQYYNNQHYFNLNENEIVSSNDRSAFDINFSCIDTLTEIRLNTANFAMAAETVFNKIEDVTDTIGLNWKYDKSDGNSDSLAFKNWIVINEDDTTFNNNVFVINRGISSAGVYLGLKKIKFTGYRNNKYFFKFSNMDNSEMHETFVEKVDGYSYVQFFLDGVGETIQTEPETNNWDLNFTQYTTLLFTDDGCSYPYLVTGVLQNSNTNIIALDTTLIFSEISISDTSLFTYSKDYDKIGYNWKEIIGDVQSGDFYYQTNIHYNYIIKDAKSYFYKLRFINFYNPDTGEKGYPTFEYQRL